MTIDDCRCTWELTPRRAFALEEMLNCDCNFADHFKFLIIYYFETILNRKVQFTPRNIENDWNTKTKICVHDFDGIL